MFFAPALLAYVAVCLVLLLALVRS